MVAVEDLGLVLGPTQNSWENLGVLNPAVISDGDVNWMFYRAIDVNSVSSIGWAQIKGREVTERGTEPLLRPESAWESRGLEDPRVIKVEGIFYMIYAVYDGFNARIAYATAEELPNFTKKGFISAEIKYDEAGKLMEGQNLLPKYANYSRFHVAKRGQDVLMWQKDAFIFPKKMRGKFVMYHRILPGIQVIEFEDFSQLTPEFWRGVLKNLDKNLVMDPKYDWESKYIGGGCPPIETADGWLVIYHAVENVDGHDIYRAGAALVDKDNPRNVIGRLAEPLFSPTSAWEKVGVVGNVVFPTGALVENDDLWVYYGAADKVIGAKRINLSQLLSQLKS